MVGVIEASMMLSLLRRVHATGGIVNGAVVGVDSHCAGADDVRDRIGLIADLLRQLIARGLGWL
jgi:hypothetical protein